MTMHKFIQVVTTVSSRRDAEKISKTLIGGKLAACAQISCPVKSIYRWKGKIETAKEWVCVIKTKKALYKKVEKLIKEIHPYEIPEIIVTPIVEGSKDYLEWLSGETI